MQLDFIRANPVAESFDQQERRRMAAEDRELHQQQVQRAEQRQWQESQGRILGGILERGLVDEAERFHDSRKLGLYSPEFFSRLRSDPSALLTVQQRMTQEQERQRAALEERRHQESTGIQREHLQLQLRPPTDRPPASAAQPAPTAAPAAVPAPTMPTPSSPAQPRPDSARVTPNADTGRELPPTQRFQGAGRPESRPDSLTGPGTAANPARPRTYEERDALPPGTYYYEPGIGGDVHRRPRAPAASPTQAPAAPVPGQRSDAGGPPQHFAQTPGGRAATGTLPNAGVPATGPVSDENDLGFGDRAQVLRAPSAPAQSLPAGMMLDDQGNLVPRLGPGGWASPPQQQRSELSQPQPSPAAAPAPGGVSGAQPLPTAAQLQAPARAARQPTGPSDRYVDTLFRYVSGGQANPAPNPRSTARGSAQFLEGTWLGRADAPGIVARLGVPRDLLQRAWAGDLQARRQVLDLRMDPEMARRGTLEYARIAAQTLNRHDMPVNDQTLALAHFLGPAGAVRFLNAYRNDRYAPIARAVSAPALRANPELLRGTVGDLYNAYRLRLGRAPPTARHDLVPAHGPEPEDQFGAAGRSMPPTHAGGRPDSMSTIVESGARGAAIGASLSGLAPPAAAAGPLVFAPPTAAPAQPSAAPSSTPAAPAAARPENQPLTPIDHMRLRNEARARLLQDPSQRTRVIRALRRHGIATDGI